MIEVHHDILNSTSRFIIVIILFVVACFGISKTESESKTTYNFVDLQMKYKNYIVVNKKRSIFNDETYLFEVENPITHQRSTIYVEYYLYHNVYFVGDTIK